MMTEWSLNSSGWHGVSFLMLLATMNVREFIIDPSVISTKLPRGSDEKSD